MTITRFKTDKSLEYIAAVRALQKLSSDDVDRAFAEVACEGIKKQATRGLVESEKYLPASPVSLLGINFTDTWAGGGNYCTYGKNLEHRIPNPAGLGHTTLWNRDGKLTTCITQPYQLGWEQLQHLVAWCQKYNITCNIDANSWHFPSRTIKVTYTKLI